MKGIELMLLFLIPLACVRISTVCYAAPINLIENPGFEKEDEYDATRPQGWNRLQSSPTTMFIDRSTFHSGKQCLSMISDPDEGTTWATKWVFNLDKGREYKFSLYTKWNGVGEGCSVRIYAASYPTRWGLSRKGKFLFGEVYNNREWERHEATFSMPDDMDKLAILIHSAPAETAHNRIWVDDVSLHPSGKAPDKVSEPTPPVYGKRPKIEIDEQSHALLLDGKPFLPIGIANPQDKEGIKAVKEQGFNAVWITQDLQHLMDDVDAHGLFAFFDVTMLTDMREWGEIKRQVSRYKEHPAVLAWGPRDEPKEMGPVLKACEIIRGIDSSRPIAINAANPSTFSGLKDMTDILMSCAYPVKAHSVMLTQDTDWMDQAAQTVEHKKPIWWWIQAYEWEGDGRILPTVAQERCMTYLAAIHGVKGFFYFSYAQMKREAEPAFWNSFKSLTSELKQLAPMILAPTPKQEISVSPQGSGVHYLLKEYQGKRTIFAANPEKEEVKVTFRLPALNKDSKVGVLFEERKDSEVTGDSFSDVFEGYGVHVYEITPAGSSEGMLWDAGEKVAEKHYDLRPYKVRDSWKLVPYGTVDYSFEGSPVIENDFFHLYFHSSPHDCIFLYGKIAGEPRIWVNELYRVYVDPKDYREAFPGDASRAMRRNYGHGSSYVKIIGYTPEAVVVESGSIPYEREGKTISVATTYRILRDKPWVEVRPVRMATEQGIHGKVRMGLAPNEDGNDFVVDSMRDLPGRLHPPVGKMLLCFYESGEFPCMWVITWSAPFEEADPWFLNDSGPKGDTMSWHGQTGCPRRSPGCITSSWAGFGKKGSAVVGLLSYWHNWHREEVDQPIKAGEEYVSSWKPPYPGRWRMTARVAENRYDQGFEYDGETEFPAKHFSQDVYDGDFTFTSPIDGWLDYIVMYMYDRTKDTPAEILTPMDQHRWTIRQRNEQ